MQRGYRGAYPRADNVPRGRGAYRSNDTRPPHPSTTRPPPDGPPPRDIMDGVGLFLEDITPPPALDDAPGVNFENIETVASYSWLKESIGSPLTIEVPGSFRSTRISPRAELTVTLL